MFWHAGPAWQTLAAHQMPCSNIPCMSELIWVWISGRAMALYTECFWQIPMSQALTLTGYSRLVKDSLSFASQIANRASGQDTGGIWLRTCRAATGGLCTHGYRFQKLLHLWSCICQAALWNWGDDAGDSEPSESCAHGMPIWSARSRTARCRI